MSFPLQTVSPLQTGSPLQIGSPLQMGSPLQIGTVRRRNLGGRVEAAGLEHIKGALRDRALFLTHRPEEFWQQRRRHWGPWAREHAPAAAQPASSCESNVASVGVQTSVPDAASAGAPPDAPPSKKTRPNKKARALHRAHLEAQGSWEERSLGDAGRTQPWRRPPIS